MDKFTSGVHDLIRGAIPKGERKNFEELVDRSTKLKAAIFKVKPDKVWGAAYDYAVSHAGNLFDLFWIRDTKAHADRLGDNSFYLTHMLN